MPAAVVTCPFSGTKTPRLEPPRIHIDAAAGLDGQVAVDRQVDAIRISGAVHGMKDRAVGRHRHVAGQAGRARPVDDERPVGDHQVDSLDRQGTARHPEPLVGHLPAGADRICVDGQRRVGPDVQDAAVTQGQIIDAPGSGRKAGRHRFAGVPVIIIDNQLAATGKVILAFDVNCAGGARLALDRDIREAAAVGRDGHRSERRGVGQVQGDAPAPAAGGVVMIAAVRADQARAGERGRGQPDAPPRSAGAAGAAFGRDHAVHDRFPNDLQAYPAAARSGRAATAPVRRR